MTDEAPITTFVVTDIEADGPSPLASSMLSLGEAVVTQWRVRGAFSARVALVLFAAASTILPLSVASHAAAASYFCSPAPFKIGSYRPDDASSELDITIQFAISTPFWFDDQSGDYMTFVSGAVQAREPAKLHVPLAWPAKGPGLEAQVAAIQVAGQCVPSAFGSVPVGTSP